MAITTAQKYILDKLASIAGNIPLGTLIQDSETNTTAGGLKPSHIAVFGGKHTTTGGAAAEDITVTGALATDIVEISIDTVGGSPVTIVTAKAAADKVTVTFSADPSTDHIVQYVVLRATTT